MMPTSATSFSSRLAHNSVPSSPTSAKVGALHHSTFLLTTSSDTAFIQGGGTSQSSLFFTEKRNQALGP